MTFTTPEASDEDLGDLLLEVLPGDGSTMGNLAAREAPRYQKKSKDCLGRRIALVDREAEMLESLACWQHHCLRAHYQLRTNMKN